MSLSPFYSFQSQFVTYLLNRPRKIQMLGNYQKKAFNKDIYVRNVTTHETIQVMRHGSDAPLLEYTDIGHLTTGIRSEKCVVR